MMRNDGKGKRLRSVWGTTPILSICNTSEAERLLGIESETLVFSNYFITDQFKYDFARFCRRRISRVLVRLLVFPWALFRYDVFHFFFDRGILPSRNFNGINSLELFLLHLFRKKIFVYTYGADVRTQEKTLNLGAYNCCMMCPDVGRACICDDSKHRRNLSRIRKYATAFLSMGDMIEYTPGSENDLFFWPIDIKEVDYVGTLAQKDSPIKIVHAPNHRHYKGTAYLIDVVNRLQAEGLPVELVLVERLPNADAMRIYMEADIFADQFLIGWHGFTAIEAMALGKPVVCYIRKREYLLKPDECPIVDANPDNLEGIIRDLAQDGAKRKRLGEQGRAYVEKYFSLEAFSKRLKKLYVKHGIL